MHHNNTTCRRKTGWVTSELIKGYGGQALTNDQRQAIEHARVAFSGDQFL